MSNTAVREYGHGQHFLDFSDGVPIAGGGQPAFLLLRSPVNGYDPGQRHNGRSAGERDYNSAGKRYEQSFIMELMFMTSPEEKGDFDTKEWAAWKRQEAHPSRLLGKEPVLLHE